ncbi:USP6 N-terminal-like protein [Lagenorhynchus albirostris]|uniref:USP6 N-terminal-like protein n=1 Tax=Lagenorhynchus albirostris TaxID=27610 RepID=UPI0028E19826|nr:USP6 N-terminal-like protein [Lagenorhynchus albirostris]
MGELRSLSTQGLSISGCSTHSARLASLPEMRRRVYKGIPPQVQGQSPKPRARLYSQDLKQIDLGGNRAFRNRIMFRERYGIKSNTSDTVLSCVLRSPHT